MILLFFILVNFYYVTYFLWIGFYLSPSNRFLVYPCQLFIFLFSALLLTWAIWLLSIGYTNILIMQLILYVLLSRWSSVSPSLIISALVNSMSCAGRNYREVLNACYDKQIIYNEWNSNCDEMKDCVNVLKEMIDIRDEFKHCYILFSDDIDFIIEDICINWFLNLFIYKTNQMYHYFFYNVWIKILLVLV